MTYDLLNNKYVRCLNCKSVFQEGGIIQKTQHPRCKTESYSDYISRVRQEFGL